MADRMSRPRLVEKLMNKWETFYRKSDYLNSVAIGEGERLRGIQNSCLEFRFPMTILCGPNSTGKTTFLALSVLAFHDDQSLTLSGSNKSYYDFSYFFGFSEREKHEEGIEIKWKYTDGKEDVIKKGKERWLRYIRNNGSPRRPQRGSEFVGLSRIVPAFEKRGYQRLFSNIKRRKQKVCANSLSDYLARVMAKPYSSIFSYETRNISGSYRLNDYNQTHTSFNAGAGEECLTIILDTLLSAKEGSVIAIEEVEIGLHPATMETLVDVMMEIILERNLQVIITTHSPEFLRACPKESLIQAERTGNSITFIHQPNIENAIYSISGKSATDLFVVCEDECAASLIEACLTKKQRNIVKINSYGSKSELIEKAKIVHKATNKKVLIIWDGDVERNLLDKINELQDWDCIQGIKLPGNTSPERFILESLIRNTAMNDQICSEYGLDIADWKALEDKLSVMTDEHDLFFILKEGLGLNQLEEIRKRICWLVSREEKDQFATIKQRINDLLSNNL
ncbi:ATP-binding protein [candidate division WWE3 bacterium]|uniref:ATP-binding protein n=1 Tax=candidate division WWE3 bacterium TaxID=2053526 RepID=A0A928TVY3_UNCKA|nr:ATP-binding protein [candidate division WWE3 bacterium]